jgi:tyrosinase
MNIESIRGFSRRDFVKGVSAVGAAGVAFWAGGCEQIAQRPMRRNIANLMPSDPIIQTYKAAVAAMKARSPSDPLSWVSQASIHNNHCPHGCWFFLPWHRWYLVYFERICRKLTGDNSFALPYWNWTSHRTVPDVFWDTSSPLYDSTRVITQSDPADPGWVGPATIESILGVTDFFLFASGTPGGPNGNFHRGGSYGMLEGNPHNNIHGWVGGDMATFMSPLDAVFWTPHNMIDCLWVDWSINRGNPNVNDPAWTSQTFTDFFDENGNPVTVTVADAALLPLLDYQFEPCDPQARTPQMSKSQLETFLKAGAPSTLRFTRRLELGTSIRSMVGETASRETKIQVQTFGTLLEASAKSRVVLIADDVEVPHRRDYFVRVFLNKTDASGQTPITDSHYAGSFAFFSDESAMKGPIPMTTQPKAGYLIDVTPALQKLSRTGGLSSGEVAISLVPVPYAHRKATAERLVIGRLELGIAQF